MHNGRNREVLCDILAEVTTPKRIDNIECLRLISDIIRFVLTLFVHEQDADYRLLGIILDCASHMYYLHNKRKQYLSYYLLDHGIWSDTGAWRVCIEINLKHKMHESIIRMKRRENRAKNAAAEKKKL